MATVARRVLHLIQISQSLTTMSTTWRRNLETAPLQCGYAPSPRRARCDSETRGADNPRRGGHSAGDLSPPRRRLTDRVSVSSPRVVLSAVCCRPRSLLIVIQQQQTSSSSSSSSSSSRMLGADQNIMPLLSVFSPTASLIFSPVYSVIFSFCFLPSFSH